jgi:predicted nucleotidyltransferase
MMVRHALLVGAVLALSMTSQAQAQLRGRGFNIPPVVQNIMMMRMEAVQKELALEEAQTKEITALAAQMQSEAMEIMSGLQDLTPEERQKEMPSVMKMITEKGKELQGKVDKVLNEKQAGRVKELSLQRRGVDALQDDAVIAELKLSDEQKQKLDAVRDEIADKQQEIFKSLASGGGDQGQVREKMMELRKEGGEKAMAILTDAQREQFEKMKGPKFDFPPMQRGLF